MAQTTADLSSCPECHSPLTSYRLARWCSRCEWNLDTYDPDRHGCTFGWRRLDRWAHRTAFRLNARQFTALAGADLARPTARITTLLLTAVSLALLAGVLGLLAGGVLLVVRSFPSFTVIPGAFLILLALALRPRFGRLDPLMERVSRDQAPTLFTLIDRVAAAVGALPPHTVGVEEDFNAAAAAVGLRRRRVLTLGLGLWAALPPPQRVALLAHELGHFCNGDIRRGLVTQPAFTTLGWLAVITTPNPRDVDDTEGLMPWLAAVLMYGVQWVVSRVLWAGHLVLVWLGLRDGQRAEYLADDRAAAAAGSAGARDLLDTLVMIDAVSVAVARAANTGDDPVGWRDAAEQLRGSLTDELKVRRQASTSDQASLFATHPPSGLRRKMIDQRPWRDPQVVLTEQDSDQIDAELAPYYRRARRSLGSYAAG